MHSYAPVEGGKKILIFTEQISRDDIEVHFTHNENMAYLVAIS